MEKVALRYEYMVYSFKNLSGCFKLLQTSQTIFKENVAHLDMCKHKAQIVEHRFRTQGYHWDSPLSAPLWPFLFLSNQDYYLTEKHGVPEITNLIDNQNLSTKIHYIIIMLHSSTLPN